MRTVGYCLEALLTMISYIQLTDFRNFEAKKLAFSSGVTVVVGPNAAGKTNILESIGLLSTGKSFRARIEEEMVRHGREVARVKGGVVSGGEKFVLEAVLTRGEITVGESPDKVEKVPRKRLLVNNLAKRLIDFSGLFKVVLFGPWDMDLVTQSPSLRRKFLDTVLSLVDREYRRAILSYEKGLRQRNKLLYRIREEGLSRGQLLFWDKLLIKNGDYITQKREEFIEFANKTEALNETVISLDYDRSIISEGRLEQYAQEEIAAATTLVGPHRDDFVFKIGKENRVRELSPFGSRGEQRMGVLWLKLAELAFVETKTGEKPTLLLDDIFSELDHAHRDVVIKMAKDKQTIITTADPHYIDSLGKAKEAKIIDL